MTKTTVTTEVFEGPLDLLLQLVEEQKLSINEISLSRVADQFLQKIKDLQIGIADLASVVDIATSLLLIKSKSLLPGLALSEEEEQGIEELQMRLRTYQFFKNAAQHLRQLHTKGNFVYMRGRETRGLQIRFVPAENIAAKELHISLERLLQIFEKVKPLVGSTLLSQVYLEQKIEDFKNKITEKISLAFDDLVQKKESREEIIVSFLALLELLRSGLIVVQQKALFDTIDISLYG